MSGLGLESMNMIQIGERRIGPTYPCFIIAEAGVNHNGNLGLAHHLIDVAVEAGADAVKFQTFKADRLVTRTAPKATYQQQNTGSDESQYEMLRQLELTDLMHHDLIAHCIHKGILFLSTPFDEPSVDLLDALRVPAFKIASGEITNLPFLAYVARKYKPMIVSTGMSWLSEVAAAVRTIADAGTPPLALLHCVSNYPAPVEEVNLRAMHTLHTAFNVPVGYSDHTDGIQIAIAAVALGASIVEKHFTLDRTLQGPDHRASLEPPELAALVRGIRDVEAALGHGRKEPAPSEAATAAVARKSLVAAIDLAEGTVLTEQHIAIKRPGTGLPPAMLPRVIGRTLRTDIPEGTLLTLDMLV